jgi:hypothetical protein
MDEQKSAATRHRRRLRGRQPRESSRNFSLAMSFFAARRAVAIVSPSSQAAAGMDNVTTAAAGSCQAP